LSALDFAAVLAIGIHDAKNSLNRVLTMLEAIGDGTTDAFRCDAATVAQLQYEARRINDNLIQLLTLYRQEKGLYQPRFAPVLVYELLEDGWLKNKPLMERSGIACTLACDERLVWTLDRDLVESVLDNVIVNDVRYTRACIRLSAHIAAETLHLLIEDDGPGYPPVMLGRRRHDALATVDRTLGRTGVGLHFCALIADCHANAEQRGYIELSNGGTLGGGCFLLRLPRIAPS